ncbi:MAG: CYTH domain-containing protein [Hyphomicrobiaceae bacterium]
MAVPQEIERKFIVKDDGWRRHVSSAKRIRQGYIAQGPRANVRARITDASFATLSIKSVNPGMVRQEYEYPIPVEEAENLLGICEGAMIEKTRNIIVAGLHTWEIDVFEGENAGLVIAELELKSIDEEFARPDWLGKEVTDDERYYNAALVLNPFSRWS